MNLPFPSADVAPLGLPEPDCQDLAVSLLRVCIVARRVQQIALAAWEGVLAGAVAPLYEWGTLVARITLPGKTVEAARRETC